MKIPIKTYVLLSTLVCLFLGAASCNTTTDVTPAAKNSISGQVEGTEFTAIDIEGTRSDNNIYSLKGIINADASFSLYIKDDGSSVHPIETEGSFSDLTQQLQDLFTADPPLPDSTLLDSLTSGLEILLSDTENLLAPNHSFMFYTVGGLIYYSLDGSYTMEYIDEELGRISGSLNARLSNFFGGRKDIELVVEDVQFYLE